mmetsp:Transcript_2889/g.8434  ORF Transcript_2889/g.8434 Transcript_2889/m.8434 type:complete len:229 (-) Transcript_2889:169-855(-)
MAGSAMATSTAGSCPITSCRARFSTTWVPSSYSRTMLSPLWPSASTLAPSPRMVRVIVSSRTADGSRTASAAVSAAPPPSHLTTLPSCSDPRSATTLSSESELRGMMMTGASILTSSCSTTACACDSRAAMRDSPPSRTGCCAAAAGAPARTFTSGRRASSTPMYPSSSWRKRYKNTTSSCVTCTCTDQYSSPSGMRPSGRGSDAECDAMSTLMREVELPSRGWQAFR